MELVFELLLLSFYTVFIGVICGIVNNRLALMKYFQYISYWMNEKETTVPTY